MTEILKAPYGLKGITKLFGDPFSEQFMDTEGVDVVKWEEEITTLVSLPKPLLLNFSGKDGKSLFAKSIRCHKFIALRVHEIYQTIYDEGLWEYLEPFGGCYCFRPKRKNSKALSTHSWGIAVDHLQLTKLFDDLPEKKALKRILDIFTKAGWVWGGSWSRNRDPMHMQYCEGY